MVYKVNLKGLRNVLQKFEEDGRVASGTHWKIAKGGYDLWWQLYYDNVPVVDCVCNEIENNCLPQEIFDKVFQVIKEEYDTNKFYPIRKAK